MSRKNWDAAGLKEALSRGGSKEHGGVVGTRSQIAEKSVPKLDSRNTDRRSEHGITKAGSNPAHAPLEYKGQQYKSKLEVAYAAHLDLELAAGLIMAWRYEPISFKLSKGKRYRPDFLVEHHSCLGRKLELIEIKGQWTKNRRDGITHLKWAAQLYPMFKWTLMSRIGQSWESTDVEV